MYIFNSFITKTENIKKNISQRQLNMLTIGLFILLSLMDIFVGTRLHYIEFRYLYIVSAMSILGLVFIFVDKTSFKKKVPKTAIVFWVVMFGTFLVNTIFASTSFMPVPVLTLFFFPVLYFAFPKEKQGELFELITKAVSIAFTAFIILSLIFRPFIGRPYVGVLTNPNYMGQFVIVVFALLMPTMSSNKKNKLHNYILIGFAAMFAFMSLSRTTWISCAAVGILWLIHQIVCHKKENLKALFLVVLKLVISTILALSILLVSTAVLFDNVNGLSKLNLPQLEADTFELLEPEANLTWRSRISVFIYRLNSSFLPEEFYEAFLGPSDPDDPGDDIDMATIINDYSSDRIEIWDAYKDAVGFLALSESERPFSENMNSQLPSAHNTFFELSFIGGILTAVCFVVLKIYLLLSAFILAIKNKKDKEYLYALLIIVGVTVTGIFADVYSPAPQLIGFMFYLAIIPIFNHIAISKKVKDMS